MWRHVTSGNIGDPVDRHRSIRTRSGEQQLGCWKSIRRPVHDGTQGWAEASSYTCTPEYEYSRFPTGGHHHTTRSSLENRTISSERVMAVPPPSSENQNRKNCARISPTLPSNVFRYGSVFDPPPRTVNVGPATIVVYNYSHRIGSSAHLSVSAMPLTALLVANFTTSFRTRTNWSATPRSSALERNVDTALSQCRPPGGCSTIAMTTVL